MTPTPTPAPLAQYHGLVRLCAALLAVVGIVLGLVCVLSTTADVATFAGGGVAAEGAAVVLLLLA